MIFERACAGISFALVGRIRIYYRYNEGWVKYATFASMAYYMRVFVFEKCVAEM